MALRDEEQRPDTRARASWGLPPKEVLGHLPAILVAVGLLMYAYLSMCYDRFYGSLGVDPNDVGLGYAGTLARSSGFAITAIAIPLVLFQGVYLEQRRSRSAGLYVPPSRPRYRRPLSPARRFLALFALYLLLGLIFYPRSRSP